MALSVRGLCKNFGANQVLRSVDLAVTHGEIHALLGENGAGKSTLIKILAGIYKADAGEVRIYGEELRNGSSPEAVVRAGVSFVHQNLGLVDELSVADNVALQVGFARSGPFVSRRRTEKAIEETLERVGARFRPSRAVAALAQDEKVLCAVARALAQQARIIVLDEISASLPGPEMDRLTENLLRLKNSGVSFLLVTHRMSEVFSFCDSLTILRDGKVSLAAPVAEVTPAEATWHILGEDLHRENEDRPESDRGSVVLSVSGLQAKGLDERFELDVHRGEVVAVCGLVGSGTRTVASCLGGAQKARGGHIAVEGHDIKLGEPYDLRRAGVAYVPGRRVLEGIFPALTLRENLLPTRSARDAWTGLGRSRPKQERRNAGTLLDEYRVKGRLEQHIEELSGGNQQKVVVARAMSLAPRVLILEDPTAGVDIGSRASIHQLILSAIDAGAAVVLISTDFDEVVQLANRAVVMAAGRVVAELEGAAISRSALANASYGHPTSPGREEERV